MMIITAIVLAAGIVSFKDADKIKSWDAWDDHKAKSVVTEIHDKRECVAWKKFNKLDPGLKKIGRLARRWASSPGSASATATPCGAATFVSACAPNR